jgi:hypothetical protein
MATTTTSRSTNGRRRKTENSKTSAGAEPPQQSDIDLVLMGIVEGVKEQCVRRPYATLGVSATVGYVLGGGLPRILTRAAIAAGARYAMLRVLREALAQYGGHDRS